MILLNILLKIIYIIKILLINLIELNQVYIIMIEIINIILEDNAFKEYYHPF
jgi:hypothetical protein